MKAYAFSFSHPLLYEMGGKAAQVGTNVISQIEGEGAEHKITDLPLPILHGWTDTRDFPAFAPQSFHDWWRKNRGKGSKNGAGSK